LVVARAEKHTFSTLRLENSQQKFGKMRYQPLTHRFSSGRDWVISVVGGAKSNDSWDFKEKQIFSQDRITDEQIIATNIDTVSGWIGISILKNRTLFICFGQSSHHLNKRLVQSSERRASRSDCPHAYYCPSAIENQGIDALIPYLGNRTTVALIGSSGVGKSTITNQLAQKDIQAVQSVREGDNRGRHTTTHRVNHLAYWGLLIDTQECEKPVVDGKWRLSTKPDIDTCSLACRCNCQHDKEPGCAVQQALFDGTLDQQRFRNTNATRTWIFEPKQDQKPT